MLGSEGTRRGREPWWGGGREGRYGLRRGQKGKRRTPRDVIDKKGTTDCERGQDGGDGGMRMAKLEGESQG
jgi:hypothetical protein